MLLQADETFTAAPAPARALLRRIADFRFIARPMQVRAVPCTASMHSRYQYHGRPCRCCSNCPPPLGRTSREDWLSAEHSFLQLGIYKTAMAGRATAGVCSPPGAV